MKTRTKGFISLMIVVVLCLAACVSAGDQKIAADISQRIKDGKLIGVSVKASLKGVTITAGDLNFPAESAAITNVTAQRLDAIGKLLKGYEQKRILIEGHTAAFGDVASQMTLSKQRAKAVADYLVAKGYAKAANIITEGKGGTVPIAPNDTEANMAKNRRVEITLLD
jgi:outer membrane protein OmpA-like peptidoglycan-associated protein